MTEQITTPYMQADLIAYDFNAACERNYWKAIVGGTQDLPVVYFKSRSSMVELVYYPVHKRFTVGFTKVSCAFGDFMASIHRALLHVLTALKAAGHDTGCPLEDGDGTLRIEFDPASKISYVSIANISDDWEKADPQDAFKVHTSVQ